MSKSNAYSELGGRSVLSSFLNYFREDEWSCKRVKMIVQFADLGMVVETVGSGVFGWFGYFQLGAQSKF